MSSVDETLSPLLATRKRIDDTIQAYLDKVAALRKRREAITTAVDIMRCADDEIESLPVLRQSAAPIEKKKRITVFDEDVVERRVLDLLRSGPLSTPQILNVLDDEQIPHSNSGVKRILNTCPAISRSGERDMTRYTLKENHK